MAGSSRYTVPVFYDSMIAKLIAWASSRTQAVNRMARALAEYQVLGIRTTIPFFLWLLDQPDYLEGRYDTTYLDRVLVERRGELQLLQQRRDGSDRDRGGGRHISQGVRRQARRGPLSKRSGWIQVARREALRG